MQFTTVFLSALAAVGSVAAPLNAVSMMADGTRWTITGFTRTITDNGATTTWSFGVDNGVNSIPCSEVVRGDNSWTLNGGPATCGPYTVTSGWSNQFGAGNEFTTFAVVDYAAGLIVYPAYRDAEVAAGTPVVPDKYYTPQKL